MASDPSLLETFRKQCRTLGPWETLLLWKMSPETSNGEVELDDLIDIAKEVTEELNGQPR